MAVESVVVESVVVETDVAAAAAPLCWSSPTAEALFLPDSRP